MRLPAFRRPLVLRLVLVVGSVLAAVALVNAATAGSAAPLFQTLTRLPVPTLAATPTPSATPSPATPKPPPGPTPVWQVITPQPADVHIDGPGFWSWALLDQATGKIAGSSNLAETSTTASMIKAWIASDYLRRLAEQGRRPTAAKLADLTKMIRDSDNAVATATFDEVGTSASIRRLISMCKLTDSSPYRTYWSNTMVSARDTARMADCIADGRAAGPQWTDWVLNEMRNVRGTGNFGIRKAFPAATQKLIAIKNGWVSRSTDGDWHVSCMAIGQGWTLGVLVRYPAQLGFTHGADVCESVAAQLIRH